MKKGEKDRRKEALLPLIPEGWKLSSEKCKLMSLKLDITKKAQVGIHIGTSNGANTYILNTGSSPTNFFLLGHGIAMAGDWRML